MAAGGRGADYTAEAEELEDAVLVVCSRGGTVSRHAASETCDLCEPEEEVLPDAER